MVKGIRYIMRKAQLEKPVSVVKHRIPGGNKITIRFSEKVAIDLSKWIFTKNGVKI